MGDIKSCPFCGGEVKLKDNRDHFNDHERAYYIVCRKCGTYYGNTKAHGSREGTMKAWNRRSGKEES